MTTTEIQLNIMQQLQLKKYTERARLITLHSVLVMKNKHGNMWFIKCLFYPSTAHLTQNEHLGF